MGTAYAFKLILVMIMFSVVGVVRSRRLKKTRKQITVDGAALIAWAGEHGWRVGDASDPDLMTLVEEMGGLLAEEGERGIGTIALGQNGAGRMVLAQTWRDDTGPEPAGSYERPEAAWSGEQSHDSGPSLALSFASVHQASPTLVRVRANGVVQAELGESTPTVAQTEALTGLPPGSRLRAMPGRLLVRVPRFFTRELADDLLRRMALLDSAQAPLVGPTR